MIDVNETLTEAEDAANRRIYGLGLTIILHDYWYHVMDDPIISDYMYDKLFHELKDLESQYPHLQRNDSPTLVQHRITGPVVKPSKKKSKATKAVKIDRTPVCAHCADKLQSKPHLFIEHEVCKDCHAYLFENWEGYFNASQK